MTMRITVRVRPGEFAKLQSELAYIGEVLWLDELTKSGQSNRATQSGAVRLSRVEKGFSDESAGKDKSWFVFANRGSSKAGGRRARF